MSKQDIVFIINPNAGGTNGTVLAKIEKLIVTYNLKSQILFTKHKGHAISLTTEYLEKGFKHFVAVGGDGTVNEVSKTLVNTPAKLSIIPVGSGNGLARSLNIPLNIEKAFALISNHAIKTIDCGLINQHHFFCTAGVGFDAICAEKFDKGKHNRGLWNYIKIIFKTYFFFKPLKVDLNNQPRSIFSITFANAQQFGNDAYIAPDAIIDDGYLDCSIINPHPKILGFYLGYLLMTKKIMRTKYSEYFRATKFSLKTYKSFICHIDGESVALESDSVEINCIPKCLLVTVKLPNIY